MATFRKAPTSNYWSTTLNGSINDSVETITRTSVTGLQAPGVIVIDREDGSGTATPSAREIVHFTGISGSDLTGCTRGEESSTARAHNDGALVEAVFTVESWNDLVTATSAVVSADGANVAVTGTASIAALNANALVGNSAVLASIASIARVETSYLKVLDGDAIFDTLSATSTATISASNIAVLENTQQAVTSVASIADLRYKVAKPAWVTDTDGETITFDMNAGNVHKVTLGGNRTLAVSNVEAGQSFVITLIQDATGSRTVTWFSDINWDQNVVPTLTTTATRADVFGFLALDSNDFYGFILGQNHAT